MAQFKVSDISCGHCVQSVTQAILTVDRDAVVDVDLTTKQVRVQSKLPDNEIASVIRAAGYTPSTGE